MPTPLLSAGDVTALADADVVYRARAGDIEAATELVERYQQVIFATALKRCGRLELARELTQDTFMTALEALPQLERPNRLRAWLFGILRNHWRDAARRNASRPAALGDEAGYVAPHADLGTRSLDREETAVLLHEALAALPARYREILIMRYFEETPVKEIAALLACTVGTVEVTLHRARKVLGKKVRFTAPDLVPEDWSA